jgi:alkylation response protein AidB-like acyl-CoA dehydrogenase
MVLQMRDPLSKARREMTTIDDFTRPKEYLTPLDTIFGGIIRDWAEKEVIPYRREYDEDWREHRKIHEPMKKLLGEYGLQRVAFSEDLGGWGLGGSDYTCVAMYRMFEEMARADSGLGLAFGASMWPLELITFKPHENRRLCEEFAPMFCETNEAVFSAMVMTEPQGGSDIENLELLKGSTIRTTAVRDGDEWVINGHKLWASNTGGLARLMAVFCTTNPGSDDLNDFAVIYVLSDMPGVTHGTPYEKAGMASDMNSDVWFENVRVPLHYRACGPGEDAKWLGEIMSTGNMGIIAWFTGSMLNVYEKVVEFVNNKKYRGRPLKENDAVAGTLADYASTLEALRILGYQSARMLDRQDLYGERWRPQAVAKARAHRYFAADKCLEAIGRVMNLMEAYGADRDRDVEKHWRDLKILQLVEGSKQLCQVEVARWFYECETL